MLLGGAVAGQGAIDIYLLIAIAWFSAWARRHDQLLHRPPARPRVRARATARASGSATSASSRSRTTSPATAARRSSSAASSASSAPSRPSSPAARACATAPSSPTASSAPGSGPAPTSSSATSSRAASRPPPSTPAKAPSCSATLIVVVVGDRLPRPPLPRSRRTGARRCAGWSATPRPRWLVALGRRFRPQLALPLGPGHPGRHLRARVHLADGGARRRPLRPDRLHGRSSAATRARPRATMTALERRRTPARRLAHRRRQGRHRPRLGRRRLAAGRCLRGAARRAPALGRVRGAAWPGWR